MLTRSFWRGTTGKLWSELIHKLAAKKFKSILCHDSLHVNLSVLCQDFGVWTIPMAMVVGRVLVFENHQVPFFVFER